MFLSLSLLLKYSCEKFSSRSLMQVGSFYFSAMKVSESSLSEEVKSLLEERLSRSNMEADRFMLNCPCSGSGALYT